MVCDTRQQKDLNDIYLLFSSLLSADCLPLSFSLSLSSNPSWSQDIRYSAALLPQPHHTHSLSLSDTHIFLFLYLWGPRVDSLASIFKAASNILFFTLEVHGSVLHLDLALTLLSARCFGFATYLQYASPSPFSHGPLFSSNTTDKTQFTLPTPGLKQ